MIYFMQPIGGGPVKIGFTNGIKTRHAQLEDHYGCELAILATTEGGRDEEARLHRRFKAIRLGQKEQFRPTADLMSFIGLPLLVGANPDAVEAIEPRVISNTRPVRLDLTPDVHRLLRLMSADEDISMAAYAREWLEKHLRAEAKRKGVKP